MKTAVINRVHQEYLNNPELVGLSIRHNLGLYNDTKEEEFVRKVAEKLERHLALTKAIADIAGQLEGYRLKQLSKQKTRKEKKRKGTDTGR